MPAIGKRARETRAGKRRIYSPGRQSPKRDKGFRRVTDKKITSALTNEGKDRPHVKVAGQDYRSSEDEAGNGPFRKRRVWSQNLVELVKLTVQTIAKIAVSNFWLGAHPGGRPSVSPRLSRR